MAPLRKHPDDVEPTIRVGRDVLDSRDRDDSDPERGGTSFRRPLPSACEAPKGGDAGQAAVRRRVLVAQLVRLAERVADKGPASLDAAARAVMLTARLDADELAW